MKRKKEHEKDRFPLEHVPVKFLKKPRQKELLRRLERKEENDESDERPSKTDPIPLDIEVEILTRLPVKSLMRSLCVSKMWSSIIRTQGFIDSYYAMSSATRPRFIVALSSSSYVKDHAKRLFIFSGEESSSSVVAANLDMIIPSLSFSRGDTCPSVHGFVGFCHGLQFTICNPSTRQVVTVPCKGNHTSFGYDPVDHQFKALIPVACEDGYDGFTVIRLGVGGAQSRSVVTSPPYSLLTKGLCIDGFLYYGALTQSETPVAVIMCFDVRNEKISFITTPKDVLRLDGNSVLIEYKGKLASIVGHGLSFNFSSFDLWILEDVKKHEWSKQTFKLPYYLMGKTSPGTNKAGEIMFAPLKLSPDDVQLFFDIYYYNVERKDVRRVRIHGIAGDERFRRHYGQGYCDVSVSPQHVQSIASL